MNAMNKDIANIFNLLQEIALCFGNHRLNGECCGDLSLVEFMALKKIYDYNKLSIQDIGIALNFTKSGATRIIDRLENKGYVMRERSAIDGRICCAAITVKGTEAIIEIMERYTVYIEDMLKDLEPQTVDNIKDALEVLVKSIHKQNFI